ncbi:MAG: right-handed parallel beta-helix repeat-containing protein, partial [Thermodesulfobacteriota bacterium]
PTPTATPLPTTLHIAPDGDDARTREQAASPDTPWKTIRHAVSQSVTGDVLLVAPGDYLETGFIQTKVPGIEIRGAAPDMDEIDRSQMRIRVPAGSDVFRIRHADVLLENLWIDGGEVGIKAFGNATGLRIVDVAVTSPVQEGIKLNKTRDVEIRGSIVTGAGKSGIWTRKAKNLLLRDLDVYANESGLYLRKGSGEAQFLTIHANQNRGVRVLNMTLTLHHSLITGHAGHAGLFEEGSAPVTLHNDLFFGNGNDINDDATPVVVNPPDTLVFDEDPMYLDADGPDDQLGGAGWGDDELFLQQPPAGPGLSPAVDKSTFTAVELEVTGSTEMAGAPDVGMADFGAHR